MTEEPTILKKSIVLLSILYWGISIIAGFIIGLYMMYHAIEAPQPDIGERIILIIFALIAIFFAWGFPLLQIKTLNNDFLKNYTIRFILMLIGAYFIIRLIIRNFGLNIYTL